MTRRGYAAVAVVCTVLGIANLGRGTYIHLKARLAQHLMHEAWERTAAGERRVPPWPWADTWPIARLRAPAQRVDLLVLAGDSGRSLAFGPGHASESAPPGRPGVSVISAHRDTHFRFLERVRVGDPLVLELPDGTVRDYRIAGTRVVDSRDTWIVNDPDADELLLVTCYPFDTPVPRGPLRFVVRAEPLAAPALLAASA